MFMEIISQTSDLLSLMVVIMYCKALNILNFSAQSHLFPCAVVHDCPIVILREDIMVFKEKGPPFMPQRPMEGLILLFFTSSMHVVYRPSACMPNMHVIWLWKGLLYRRMME